MKLPTSPVSWHYDHAHLLLSILLTHLLSPLVNSASPLPCAVTVVCSSISLLLLSLHSCCTHLLDCSALVIYFFHEFWPSVNGARQWNAHSLSPCLYIVMWWPCAVKTSWRGLALCYNVLFAQCSPSMSKHLPFLIWNSLSSACQQQVRITLAPHTHTRARIHPYIQRAIDKCDRPWWAKH